VLGRTLGGKTTLGEPGIKKQAGVVPKSQLDDSGAGIPEMPSEI
jgi:hypothetical protein